VADVQDYSNIIVEKLSLTQQEAFDSLDRLAKLYYALIPVERGKWHWV